MLQSPDGDVFFFDKANFGDDNKPGLMRLDLPAKWKLPYRQRRLREAMAALLRSGSVPTAFEEVGDAGTQKDAMVEWEWRFSFHGIAVYVKTQLDEFDPKSVALMIKDVGLAD